MESLKAGNYNYSGDIYQSEFEIILSKLVICYKMMINDFPTLPRNENEIRNTLSLNYLRNDEMRAKLGLTNYLFDRESMEDHSVGRTDIKIQTLKTFIKQDAYYTIECKLIDNKNTTGPSGLNAKYIANGICRFTSTYYHTSDEKVNGMIGFVVAPIDINCNIHHINYLMTTELKNSNSETINANLISGITKTTFIEDFEYQYKSEHKLTDERNISLYHLMFDFSKNMMSWINNSMIVSKFEKEVLRKW